MPKDPEKPVAPTTDDKATNPNITPTTGPGAYKGPRGPQPGPHPDPNLPTRPNPPSNPAADPDRHPGVHQGMPGYPGQYPNQPGYPQADPGPRPGYGLPKEDDRPNPAGQRSPYEEPRPDPNRRRPGQPRPGFEVENDPRYPQNNPDAIQLPTPGAGPTPIVDTPNGPAPLVEKPATGPKGSPSVVGPAPEHGPGLETPKTGADFKGPDVTPKIDTTGTSPKSLK